MNKNLHVVVLMGGWSSEREVSLSSGKGVAEALRERGWTRVTELDMERDVAARLAELKPDVVFNALHGTPGEDGTVQGMMDLMGLRYTHSGCTTSAVAIDKELTKAVLVPHGVRMPKGKMVESESLHREDPLPRPYVVKPVNEGSSVGVAIVTADGNYGNPIGRDVPGPWNEFDELLAEPFIKGRELTVAVLNGEPMAVTELKIDSGFYDYEHKYTDGRTVHVCPAEVPENIAAAMMDDGRARPPIARLQGRLALRFPLGRGAGRGGPLPARDQHPAGHDSAQPGSRAGAGQGHRLWRARRAADCRDARQGTSGMSAAHVRRGGAARGQPRKSRKVAVPKKIASRLPVSQASANKVAGLAFAGFLLVIGLFVLIALDIPAQGAACRRGRGWARRLHRQRLPNRRDRAHGPGANRRRGHRRA